MNIINILAVFGYIAWILLKMEYIHNYSKPIFDVFKPDIYYYEQAFSINFTDKHRDVENDIQTANLLNKLEYIDESNELTKSLVSKPALYLYAQNLYKNFYEIKSNPLLTELMKNTEWKRYNLKDKEHQVLYLMSYNTSNSVLDEPILKYTNILQNQNPKCDFITDYKEFEILDSNAKKQEKDQALKSKKIFILYNKPVFVYTIGLCKSKINAIEVLLPKLFFHFQNQLNHRCLNSELFLEKIPCSVFITKFIDALTMMIQLGSFNFRLLFEDNLLIDSQVHLISKFSHIELRIFNHKFKSGKVSLDFKAKFIKTII